MPITDPVTPDRATPERCQEVFDAYCRYLKERDGARVADDPERANKVERSLAYCERTLAYFMSFLLQPDGSTDPITDEVRWSIRELREDYADSYTVPMIEAQAYDLAKSHHKRARASARASVERLRRTQDATKAATSQPAPEEDPLEALRKLFGIKD